MAGWTDPRTWVVGEITTKALLDEQIRDNSRYLKGKDGVVAIEDGMTFAGIISGAMAAHFQSGIVAAAVVGGGVSLASHDVATTGVHGVGTGYLAKASGSQYIAVNQDGDTNLGRTWKRAGDDQPLDIHGGQDHGAIVTAHGKNHASFPGAIHGEVPNAAKDGWVTAFRFEGASDTPEMTAGRIPKARIPDFTHDASYHTQFTNFVERYGAGWNPDVSGAWETLSISGQVNSGAGAAFMMLHNGAAEVNILGVRKVGSGVDRYFSMQAGGGRLMVPVQVSSGDLIEGYAQRKSNIGIYVEGDMS